VLDNMREATQAENQMIVEKRFVYASDPKKKFFSPEQKEPVPYLDFSPLQNSLAQLATISKVYSDSTSRNENAFDNLNSMNTLLYQCEQNLLTETGLPRRPWYRHTIYAPGNYTGYGVKTLPGIREAIEQRNWEEARDQIIIAAKAIESYSADIEKAVRLMTANNH
jgi:N-acetylated-alpha-linked acidic dipeptidase